MDHYAFWPSTSIKTRNEISSALQAAFWEQLPRCPRKLFLTASNTLVPISLAIFDTRGSTGHRSNVDPVASLIIRARPTYALINSSVVINGLNPAQKASSFICLTPEYVRRLLREASIEAILNQSADSDLKGILLFISDQRSIGTLDGCYILRRVDGKIAKIAKDGAVFGLRRAKRMLVVDREGLRLFKDLGADCIISPAILDTDVLGLLELEPTYNVRMLDGTAIDIFLRSVFSTEATVKTFNKGESAWLYGLYNFVNARKFTVTSYEHHPMLPLSNKGGRTFVSMAFWNDPRLLPPVNDPSQRQIIEQFPDLHVLVNLNLEAMKKRVTASAAHCFLLYLYIVVRDESDDGGAVERLFREKRLVTGSNIDVRAQLERLLREEKLMPDSKVRTRLEKLFREKKLTTDSNMEVGNHTGFSKCLDP